MGKRMQSNSKPLISIVTICFNSAKTIRKTIESVLNQTYTNIEYILVDGASIDDTVAIIKEYEQQFIAKGIIYRWISELDNGIYDALNKGILLATGEWLGIIHSDDWYEADALEKLFITEAIEDYDLVYGLVKVIAQNNQIHSVEQKMFTSLPTDPMQHQGVFVKRKLHEDIGLYSTSYKIAADYDFLLKCFLANKKAKFILCVVASFSRVGISNSDKMAHISVLETYQILYRNGLISKTKLVLVGYVKVKLLWVLNQLRKCKRFL